MCFVVGSSHDIDTVTIRIFSHGLQDVSYGYTSAVYSVIYMCIKLDPKQHVLALESVLLLVTFPWFRFIYFIVL